MNYVDGYVLPVPTKNLEAYAKMAKLAAKVWIDHGALEYRETVGEDLDAQWGVPFPKMVKTKPGETVVFAWVVYKSRAHRDRVNEKVMADPRLAASMDECKGIFDCKRMICGGFTTLVKAAAKSKPKPKK